MMTVKELIEFLQDCEPEAVVVTPGSDHSYDEVGSVDEEEAVDQGGHISEYYGPEYLDEDNPGEVIKVVVLRQ